ncbi:YitT family protein [Anaeromicropila herbilytica]|uniref:Membrane protein n=1 Tax=Anaeromicropila herbilytica TaxID=2785025 RepID=A0A7R7EMP2_9FIRM|nr:YitT family protein [Anaeromicropila herbilytica]BCN31765.1 membrane protein [Anaeromicropila herbilytica]
MNEKSQHTKRIIDETKKAFHLKANLINILYILAGNTIYGLAIVMFILPNKLITGGTTGLALFFHHQWNVPMSIFITVFNVSMFLLGALFLGKRFALTTIVSTFYYPFIFSVMQNLDFLKNMTDDALLSVIFSGIMIGVGIGIVIKAGASTGGMDIPPLILNKKFGLSVSVVLYALDFVILLLQMLFANKEQVLYGILLVVIYTVVLDKVLFIGKSQLQVKIISEEYEKINHMVIHELDRGSTLIHANTGYCRNESLVVLTVITNRELPKLNEKVLEIDPQAFMIIHKVNEVKGRGFTTQKEYRNDEASVN